MNNQPDIVERLRDPKWAGSIPLLHIQAADEIERLRGTVRVLKEYARLEEGWSFACNRLRSDYKQDDPQIWVDTNMGKDSITPVGAWLKEKRQSALAAIREAEERDG